MKASTEQDYQQRIVRTLAHIQQHLDGELDLDQLAGVAAFSPFHFHRIFRALVGESPKEHVRRLRLERAARRLKQQDAPVTEIALEAGFEAHESFTRAFGAMFGVAPSDYRIAHRPLPEHASRTHFEDIAGYRLPECGEPIPVEVREIAPLKIAYLRHVGPYSQVGAAWGRLMSWAGARGLLGGSMRLIGIVHDDPEVTPVDKIRYDAALVVNGAVQPEAEIGVREISGGAYAVLTHRGPYETLGKTYQGFFAGWLPKSGRDAADKEEFEEYLNSPMNAKPEDFLTRIHVPLTT